jgi:FkbM family methyltransferase
MTIENFSKFNAFGVEFDLYDPDNSVPVETKPGKVYEPSITKFLLELLATEKQLTFADVGAHYGYFTSLVGSINKNVSIHCFEPNPGFIDILKTNIARNAVNANIHAIALSDSTGSIPFFNRTMKTTDTTPGAFAVASETFDNYIASQSIAPNIVKIDVHGAEGKVLKGMKNSLNSIVKHLFVEIHAKHILVDYTYAEIFAFIKQSGMLIYELVDFRYNDTPLLKLLTEEELAKFSDYSTWTDEQINFERMIYACANT